MKDKQSAIPKATAKRLSLYYRIFKRFHAEKIERANSKQIAEAIGIDFSHDTYDGGIHMNVYGAEKVARFLGPELLKVPGVSDRRQEEALAVWWEEKCRVYDEKKAEQEEEFSRLGYLEQFYQGQ